MDGGENEEGRGGDHRLAANQQTGIIKAEDERMKRSSLKVSVRKDKREKALTARRKRTGGSGGGGGSAAMPVEEGKEGFMDAATARLIQLRRKIETIPQHVVLLRSSSLEEQKEGLEFFRSILATENDAPVEEVLACGVLPDLIGFLRRGDHPPFQFEAAWALTNVACGDSTHRSALLRLGAVEQLIALLYSTPDDVREQSLWALANVASDSAVIREEMLQKGFLEALVHVLYQRSQSPALSLMKHVAWTVCNLNRFSPPLPKQACAVTLRMLAELVQSRDEEMLADACLGLSYVAQWGVGYVQIMLEEGVMRRVLELTVHSSLSLRRSAVHVVRTMIAEGDDLQRQTLLAPPFRTAHCLGVVLETCVRSATAPTERERSQEFDREGDGPGLGERERGQLAADRRAALIAEAAEGACVALQHVAEGGSEWVQLVLDGHATHYLQYFIHHGTHDCQVAAGRFLSATVRNATPQQQALLLQRTCVSQLCGLLEIRSDRLLEPVIGALGALLAVGRRDPASEVQRAHVAQLVVQAEGADAISSLVHHRIPGISAAAAQLEDVLERASAMP